MNSSTSVLDFGVLLASGRRLHIVDVRTPAEFAECHVRGAKLIPLDALDPRQVAEALQPAPDMPIYLLCKSGGRAGKAAERLRAAGLTWVTVIAGGTDACAAAGLPVNRGKQSA